MGTLDLIGVGSSPNDGNGDPLRTAFGKHNSNMQYLMNMFNAARMATGFDREDTSTLGRIQYCFDASSGVVYNIDKDGVLTTLTSQTTFADGSTALADRTIAHYKSSGETNFSYWLNGVYTEVGTLKTLQLANSTGSYYIGYDGTGDLVTIADAHEAIVSSALIALVYNNLDVPSVEWLSDERHGMVQSGQTHLNLHKTHGFAWPAGSRDGGLDITGLADNATTFTKIASGYCDDEDVKMTFAELSTIPFVYRSGANGTFIHTADDNKLGYFDGGKCVYNEWDGATWKLSEINLDYVIMSIWATNNLLHPIVKMIGQTLHANRGAARDNLPGTILDLSLNNAMSPEAAPLYSYIIHNESTGKIEVGSDGEIYVDYRYGYPISIF